MSNQGKLNKTKLAFVVGIPAWYLLWVALIAWIPGFHEALIAIESDRSATWNDSAWVKACAMSIVAVIAALIIYAGWRFLFVPFWGWLHR